MISIISFIVVIFGCMNWLSIGLFQYDIVAGLFGYQGSIFSRMVYIIVGVAAFWLVFSVIKNKGRLNPQKLKHQERPLYNKDAKQEQVLRELIEEDESKNEENSNSINDKNTQIGTGRNHSNLQNI